MRALFVIDPLHTLAVAKDSTLAMIEAMNGWQVDVVLPSGLSLTNDGVVAYSQAISLNCQASDWYQLGSVKAVSCDDYDVVMLRKDPPFDSAYLNLTYLLDFVQANQCLVVNNPGAVRDANEKMFARVFSDFVPPSVYASQIDVLQEFIDTHRHVVVKPLNLMGGRGVFQVCHDDPNRQAILDAATHSGQSMVVMQKFIPEIAAGDKRILMINGEPVDYLLARIPAPGDFRGNLAMGARGVCRSLSLSERALAKYVGPRLRAMGLIFVGLDLIGDFLTEINVTCPTCIREIEAGSDCAISHELIAQLHHAIGAYQAEDKSCDTLLV